MVGDSHGAQILFMSPLLTLGRRFHGTEIILLFPLYHSLQYFSERKAGGAHGHETLVCPHCPNLGSTSARIEACTAQSAEALLLSPLSHSWQYFRKARGRR
jgi:hypothetical protein